MRIKEIILQMINGIGGVVRMRKTGLFHNITKKYNNSKTCYSKITSKFIK